MDNPSIFDLFDDDPKTDPEEILNQLVSSIKSFAIYGPTENALLDELYESYPRLVTLVPEDWCTDPEKKKCYFLGLLYSSFCIFKELKEEHELQKSNLELLLKNKYVYDFICFLYDQKVVRIDELCKHMKISKSTLMRFLAEIKFYDYFTIQKYGRRSYCYITPDGVKLHSAILKMKQISEDYNKFSPQR